ncbi:hypothetical protein KGQ25_03070 [Patescibacteria group bacterium]|nr:hypothetical protein [Patescibacteria group bacterium]
MPTTPANQISTEYFFRRAYDLIGMHTPADYSSFQASLAHLWLGIVIIGYVLSILGLFVIAYATMRLFDLREREEEYYGTLVLAPETTGGANPRWEHIESLAGGTSASEWREAIIEADIMLDDMLTKQGYEGEGIGEKLKSVEPSDFNTLQDAWEAHKVRNLIAHEGSSFDLSETLARRTIARYESVFREFKMI